jgi:hypothetical protein
MPSRRAFQSKTKGSFQGLCALAIWHVLFLGLDLLLLLCDRSFRWLGHIRLDETAARAAAIRTEVGV